MTGARSRIDARHSTLPRRLANCALGLFLLPFVAGCGGREEQVESKSPGDAPQAAEAVPAFNRDVHVVKELWKELQTLEQVADPGTEKKRQALRQAIKERFALLDASPDKLGEKERSELSAIRRGLLQDSP